jgi:hypothetical protein
MRKDDFWRKMTKMETEEEKDEAEMIFGEKTKEEGGVRKKTIRGSEE